MVEFTLLRDQTFPVYANPALFSALLPQQKSSLNVAQLLITSKLEVICASEGHRAVFAGNRADHSWKLQPYPYSVIAVYYQWT